jgi:DNA-binding NarL/FixJ family response regulator
MREQRPCLIGGNPILDSVARCVLRHYPDQPFRIVPRDLRIGGNARHLRTARHMIFLAALRAGMDKTEIGVRLNLSKSDVERAASIVEALVQIKEPLRKAWLGVCHELDVASLVTQ